MEKPSSIAYRELTEKIQQTVNSCGLPAFVLVPVFREILGQLIQLEEQQYKSDDASYRAALLRESRKKEEQEQNDNHEGV